MNDSILKEKIKSIAEAAEQACILEASAEKPGNVTPTHSFRDTTFSDFEAGARALKPTVAKAAYTGFKAGSEKISSDQIHLGKMILQAVSDVRKSHDGGNTHLGIALLFIPISVAAGLCLAEKKDVIHLSDSVHRILAASTIEDAVYFYDAVNISTAGGLPKSELDVKRVESKKKIVESRFTLLDILHISAVNDRLAEELTNDLRIVLGEAYPLLSNITSKINSVHDAIVQAFLVVLSKYPDTLISKKVGVSESERVSTQAREVLDLGGVLTDEGKAELKVFDKVLRANTNNLNPGTTADLVAAALFVSLLEDILRLS
ncbi:MAG: triphosphoribosyl-dephospho-CoA synthase [Methanobacteriota archaeon]